MGSPDQKERLEAIEKLLEELRKREGDVAIVVEGDRDVSALRTLGVPEPIVKLNAGVSLVNFCEALAREHSSFILLTDWDRKGNQLAKRMEQLLKWTGKNVDSTTRRRLGRLLPYQIHEVESLDGHIARLRRAVRDQIRP